MATRDEIYSAIRNADKAGDGEAIRKLGAYLQTMDAAQVEKPAPSRGVGGVIGDLAAGAVRGAGSIGATLLAPVDAAAQAMGVQNDYIGRTDRREQMDAGLQSLGADPSSVAFQGGKVAAEVAGTLGVGGALATPLRGVAPGLAGAVSTAGFKAPNMLSRIAGGAVTGGASAGLIDPSSAATGAVVGAALPPALAGAGKIGAAIGRTVSGPAIPENALAGIAAAREAGYVIPPTQARPSLLNRLLEGTAGKITTAQNASARNQSVSNNLVRQSLGIAEDVPLSADTFKGIRSEAGKIYEAVRGTGTIKVDDQFIKAIDGITSASTGAERSFPGLVKNDVADVLATLKPANGAFEASDAVDAIKVLRDSADTAYGRQDKAAGKAYRAASEALEGALERHLAAIGSDESVSALKGARQLIAKTYSAESALNPATGNIEANKLAAMLRRGKPLTGEMRAVAEFNAQFPKASQNVAQMGSLPQTSPLDWTAATGLSLATANPLMLATAAARPLARATSLSPMVQNRLIPQPAAPNALAALLAEPAVQLGYRAAPPGLSSR